MKLMFTVCSTLSRCTQLKTTEAHASAYPAHAYVPHWFQIGIPLGSHWKHIFLPTKGAVAIVVPAWRMNLGRTCGRLEEAVATSITKVVSVTPDVVVFVPWHWACCNIQKIKSLDSFVTGSHFILSACLNYTSLKHHLTQGMSWSVWSTWRPKRRSGKMQRKRPLVETLPILNVAMWCKTSKPGGVCHALLIEHLGFFICRFGKTLFYHLTFAVLADSEWRRSCCHEAALVISTDGGGAKNQGTTITWPGPWETVTGKGAPGIQQHPQQARQPT